MKSQIIVSRKKLFNEKNLDKILSSLVMYNIMFPAEIENKFNVS